MEYIIKFNDGQEHFKKDLTELLESIENNLVDAEDGGVWRVKVKVEIDFQEENYVAKNYKN